MRCEDLQAQLELWIIGEPTPELEAHAAECPECAARFAEERAFEERLRSALFEEAPRGLEARLKAALPAPKRRARRHARLIALAAALLLGINLWWAARPRPIAALIDARGAVELSRGATTRVIQARKALLAGDRLLADLGEGAVVALSAGQAQLGEASAARLDEDQVNLQRGWARCRGALRIQTPVGEAQLLDGEALIELQEVEMKASTGIISVGVSLALVVTVYQGVAVVRGAEGPAVEVEAGQKASLRAGEAPRRLALESENARLREALEEAQARIEVQATKIKALEAKGPHEGAEAEGEDEAAPPSVEEMRETILALAKDEGTNAYGQVSKDGELIQSLRAMGPEGVALLTDLLKGGDDMQRFVAAALMEKLDNPAAIPALEAAVLGENSGNILVQRMASHALGAIGGEAAIPSLERVVEGGAEWGIRTNAAYSLADMGREAGVEFFLEQYNTLEEPTQKATILRVMGKLGHERFLPTLHEVLQNEGTYSQRYAALSGVSKAGSESSLPTLQAIIENPEEDKMLILEAKKAYNAIADEEAYPLD